MGAPARSLYASSCKHFDWTFHVEENETRRHLQCDHKKKVEPDRSHQDNKLYQTDAGLQLTRVKATRQSKNYGNVPP